MQLFTDMRLTLIKIQEQLTSDLDIDLDIKEFMNINFHSMEVEDCMDQFRQIYIITCECVKREKISNKQNLIDKVISTIKENYFDSNLSVYSFASDLNVSASYFSKYFKQQTGEIFSVYLENIRLEHACKLLRETDESVDAIAKRVGYNSAYSFRRAFKRHLGLTPTEYKN
jgi:AraC-like DNA-binding protein